MVSSLMSIPRGPHEKATGHKPVVCFFLGSSLLINILTCDQSYRFMFGADMNDLENVFKILQDAPQP